MSSSDSPDGRSLVSSVDSDLLGKYFRFPRPHHRGHWEWRTRRYRGRKRYRVVMRRMLGQRIPRGMHVDHINGDTEDDRRENLRLATPLQNAANRRPTGRGSSQYKGVCHRPGTQNLKNPWSAQISVSGLRGQSVKIHIGYYGTEWAAAAAYNQIATEWYGEYARCNVEGQNDNQ